MHWTFWAVSFQLDRVFQEAAGEMRALAAVPPRAGAGFNVCQPHV